jgi:endoglucanase Acf2
MRPVLGLSLSLIFGSVCVAQIVHVGKGSYTDQLACDSSVPVAQQHIFGPGEDGAYIPAEGGGDWKATIPAIPKVTSNLAGRPVPTNDWWSSLVWKRSVMGEDAPYSSPMFAYPLAFKAVQSGLQVSSLHTGRGTNPKFVHTGFASELTVGLEGLKSADARVHTFTDLTVTADWANGTLRGTFGRGLPFVWFTRFSKADARIELNGPGAEVISTRGGVALVKIDGRYFGLFAPAASEWQVKGKVLTNALAGRNHFSVGLLPSSSDAQALKDLPYFQVRAYAEPIAAKVRFRYDEARSSVTTDFEITTRLVQKGHGELNQTVLALLPHHYRNTSAKLAGFTYDSPRGLMKVLDGDDFQVKYTYHGILPTLPLVAKEESGYSKDQLKAFLKQTEGYRGDKLETIGTTVLRPGSYWLGKHLGQMVQTAFIADQVGQTSLRDQHVEQMRLLLEDLFTAAPEERERLKKNEWGPKLMHYDKNWGTLIAFPSEFGSDCNLNDHHFHYGYWLMAAAAVARFDPAWARKDAFGGMVDLMIRDVVSVDAKDQLFPRLRNFDPYAGHCWASGHASEATGNNQESSSEAINFHAALIQWGEATGNRAMRDLGVCLYTTEVVATEEYWFDIHGDVFPRLGYTHPVTGILWGDGQEYRLWWTEIPEGVLGIQVIPVTGASLYLGRDPKQVLNQYRKAVTQDKQHELMQDLLWSYLALADPAKAIERFQAAGPDYVPENGGESRVHTYHWLHNLAALGTVDWTITADTACYAVFDRKGTKIHVAYNPGSKPRTVRFSDGTNLKVPPRQMAVH